jgi:hypothetical protein
MEGMGYRCKTSTLQHFSESIVLKSICSVAYFMIKQPEPPDFLLDQVHLCAYYLTNDRTQAMTLSFFVFSMPKAAQMY